MIEGYAINDPMQPSRSEVRDYVIDLLGQLATMAAKSGDRELADRIRAAMDDDPHSATRHAG